MHRRPKFFFGVRSRVLNVEMIFQVFLFALATASHGVGIEADHNTKQLYVSGAQICPIPTCALMRLKGGGERSGPDVVSRRRLVKGRRKVPEQQNEGYFTGISGFDQQQPTSNSRNSNYFQGQPSQGQPSFGFGAGSTTGTFGGGANPLGFSPPSFPNRLAGNPFLSPFNPVPTAQAPQQPPAPPTAAAAVNPFGLPPPHSQTPGAQPSFRPSSVFLGGFGGGNASAGFPFPAPFGAPGAVPRHARKRCRRTREGFRATETARPSPVLGAAPQGCGPAS